MSSQLVQSGHNVTVICGSYANAKTGLEQKPFIKGVRKGNIDGLNIIEIDYKYSNKLNFFRRAFLFLKFSLFSSIIALRENYEIIFATSTPLTSAIPGIVFKIIHPKKKFVLEIRDLWPELPREMGVISNPIVLGLLGLLEKLAYIFADTIIGLAPGICKSIQTRFPQKRVEFVPNGSDSTNFINKKECKLPFKKQDSDFIFIYSGTIGIANNIITLLEAAHELQLKKIDRIKILIVGDGKQKEELLLRAKLLNLTNVFFLDPVSKQELSYLFEQSDAGLQLLKNVKSFYNGTSPNKFFDYIAAGLPVVINYPGWIADLITSNKCGVLSEPLKDSLSEKMVECMGLDNKKMSLNAINLSEKSFNWKKLSRQWENILLSNK